jgi:hypothetical protein
MLPIRIETLKTSLLAVGILAGCTAELFHTPSELRGVWQLEDHGRILVISERRLSVYTDTGGSCVFDYREDFAGPRVAKWEAVLSADRETLRFREPGSDILISASRLADVPDRCVIRS